MNDKAWYVAVGGQQQGPMSRDEVVAGIRGGRFGRDAHVFTQGMSNWVPIGSEPEFSGAFGAAAPPPPPPGVGAAHEIDYELFGEDMQYVEITLDPGEACIAEAGAFLYMDPGIQMVTLFGNGGASRQKVAFAAPYPGKIVPLDLRQHGGRILCEKDAFLCAAKGIS